MEIKSSVVGIAIVALIIGAAGGYFGSTTFGKSAGSSGDHQGRPGGFQGRSRQNGQWQSDSGRVFGKVQSVNDGRITVQSQNGGSQIVLFNDSTSYQQTVDGSVNDVTTGTQVLVTGQQNPDGSTTATTIQILPEETNFPFNGRQHNSQEETSEQN